MEISYLPNGLWFDPRSLQKLVPDGYWTRGLGLYRNQKVLSIEIDPDAGHWIVQGEVQGTEAEPYEVHVETALTPDNRIAFWDCECSCAVGSDCKHGVALMLKAAYHGLQVLSEDGGELQPRAQGLRHGPSPEELEASRQAAQARADEATRRLAEEKLMGWLDALDQAGGAVPANAPVPSDARARDNIKPEQYLYLLTIQGAQTLRPVLYLEAVVAYPKVTGGWSKPKAIKTAPSPGQVVYDRATDNDKQVLQLLRAMPDANNYRFGYTYSAQAALQGTVGEIALTLAASTGRLFMDDGKGSAGTQVQMGPVQELLWHWQEVPSPNSPEPNWTLRARLATGSAKLCLNKPPYYVDANHGVVGLAQAPGVSTAQLHVLLHAPALKPSALKTHQAALMERLGPVPLPPVLDTLITLKDVVPTARLHLRPNLPEDVPEVGMIQAELRFDYAGHVGWWAGHGNTVVLENAQGRYLLHRDTAAELDAVTRLFDLGLQAGDNGVFGIPGDQAQHAWLHWADTGYQALRDAGFAVSVDDTLTDWITHADALDVRMRPEGEDEATSPWFELSLGMEINGQRHNILPLLPELIAAAANSPLDPETGQPQIPPYVYLPSSLSKGFLRLPTEALKPWMAALLEMVGERPKDFAAESLRLNRLDAMRTTASLGEGALWEGASALQAMVKQLAGATALPEVPVPASVQASLRPYQQQGLNWLQFLRSHGLGGILADDMGLGKTLQTLTHIQVEKDAGRLTAPALIIAPVSLMGNWLREAQRFCPQLRTLVLHGKERHTVAANMAEHDIVIAPYSLLMRDRERWLETQWHIVVLDEAQNIKNANTNAAQVVNQLQVRHRLCLSGTPIENHLGEIWSLFHFLMPGFLGSQARFNQLFRTPIERQGEPERLGQLRARITPFMLRRTKALVAHELPPKVETVMRVELQGQQADLYETIRLGMEKSVREALNAKGLAKSHITILDALMKLRQVCCDPQLLDMPAAQAVTSSAKLEQLMDMLPEMIAEGRRILLFSQFTGMLSRIEQELKKAGLRWTKLTGQTQKREEAIASFTSGEVPLFLISLKAGGVGLNLPQADTVIHFDPWWNPAAEAQATDRAHRIGQTQSVFVYKLVAQGTIEERILDLQERKASLADSLYSGATGRKEPLFTESDLAELLKPLSD
ncbi:DEAD/DEAH box helicase [Rhodoferax aquaticus]|uniref:Helicase SNF2 n=1 Tax=Rhodoferax aquaticus TaxID=2527691 RepID=A0A515EUG6_9BURK|nr:DEAD/DEAH box helicase [Rhodoferax aquaticus]QDL56324.1 helicase SNF2 [Rhodoferax aquaticus]